MISYPRVTTRFSKLSYFFVIFARNPIFIGLTKLTKLVTSGFLALLLRSCCYLPAVGPGGLRWGFFFFGWGSCSVQWRPRMGGMVWYGRGL